MSAEQAAAHAAKWAPRIAQWMQSAEDDRATRRHERTRQHFVRCSYCQYAVGWLLVGRLAKAAYAAAFAVRQER